MASLTGPLPFDDDEFDHVRFTEVALGIPENKVSAALQSVFISPILTVRCVVADGV